METTFESYKTNNIITKNTIHNYIDRYGYFTAVNKTLDFLLLYEIIEKLETISISRCYIKNANKVDFSNFEKLASFYINHSEIDALPIINNINVENINIINNTIYGEDKELKGLENCRSLKKIELEGNYITKIPSLKDCVNLNEVRVDINNLTEIPNLEHLTKLLQFTCSDNQLTNLPNLPNNIAVLNVSQNQLTELPPIYHNQMLRNLYFEHNKIKNFPILHFHNNIKAIKCNDNQLTTLYPIFKIVKYKLMRALKIDNNNITDTEYNFFNFYKHDLAEIDNYWLSLLNFSIEKETNKEELNKIDFPIEVKQSKKYLEYLDLLNTKSDIDDSIFGIL